MKSPPATPTLKAVKIEYRTGLRWPLYNVYVPAPMSVVVEKKIVPPRKAVGISGGSLMAFVVLAPRIAKW